MSASTGVMRATPSVSSTVPTIIMPSNPSALRRCAGCNNCETFVAVDTDIVRPQAGATLPLGSQRVTTLVSQVGAVGECRYGPDNKTQKEADRDHQRPFRAVAHLGWHGWIHDRKDELLTPVRHHEVLGLVLDEVV